MFQEEFDQIERANMQFLYSARNLSSTLREQSEAVSSYLSTHHPQEAPSGSNKKYCPSYYPSSAIALNKSPSRRYVSPSSHSTATNVHVNAGVGGSQQQPSTSMYYRNLDAHASGSYPYPAGMVDSQMISSHPSLSSVHLRFQPDPRIPNALALYHTTAPDGRRENEGRNDSSSRQPVGHEMKVNCHVCGMTHCVRPEHQQHSPPLLLPTTDSSPLDTVVIERKLHNIENTLYETKLYCQQTAIGIAGRMEDIKGLNNMNQELSRLAVVSLPFPQSQQRENVTAGGVPKPNISNVQSANGEGGGRKGMDGEGGGRKGMDGGCSSPGQLSATLPTVDVKSTLSDDVPLSSKQEEENANQQPSWEKKKTPSTQQQVVCLTSSDSGRNATMALAGLARSFIIELRKEAEALDAQISDTLFYQKQYKKEMGDSMPQQQGAEEVPQPSSDGSQQPSGNETSSLLFPRQEDDKPTKHQNPSNVSSTSVMSEKNYQHILMELQRQKGERQQLIARIQSLEEMLVSSPQQWGADHNEQLPKTNVSLLNSEKAIQKFAEVGPQEGGGHTTVCYCAALNPQGHFVHPAGGGEHGQAFPEMRRITEYDDAQKQPQKYRREVEKMQNNFSSSPSPGGGNHRLSQGRTATSFSPEPSSIIQQVESLTQLIVTRENETKKYLDQVSSEKNSLTVRMEGLEGLIRGYMTTTSATSSQQDARGERSASGGGTNVVHRSASQEEKGTSPMKSSSPEKSPHHHSQKQRKEQEESEQPQHQQQQLADVILTQVRKEIEKDKEDTKEMWTQMMMEQRKLTEATILFQQQAQSQSQSMRSVSPRETSPQKKVEEKQTEVAKEVPAGKINEMRDAKKRPPSSTLNEKQQKQHVELPISSPEKNLQQNDSPKKQSNNDSDKEVPRPASSSSSTTAGGGGRVATPDVEPILPSTIAEEGGHVSFSNKHHTSPQKTKQEKQKQKEDEAENSKRLLFITEDMKKEIIDVTVKEQQQHFSEQQNILLRRIAALEREKQIRDQLAKNEMEFQNKLHKDKNNRQQGAADHEEIDEESEAEQVEEEEEEEGGKEEMEIFTPENNNQDHAQNVLRPSENRPSPEQIIKTPSPKPSIEHSPISSERGQHQGAGSSTKPQEGMPSPSPVARTNGPPVQQEKQKPKVTTTKNPPPWSGTTKKKKEEEVAAAANQKKREKEREEEEVFSSEFERQLHDPNRPLRVYGRWRELRDSRSDRVFFHNMMNSLYTWEIRETPFVDIPFDACIVKAKTPGEKKKNQAAATGSMLKDNRVPSSSSSTKKEKVATPPPHTATTASAQKHKKLEEEGQTKKATTTTTTALGSKGKKIPAFAKISLDVVSSSSNANVGGVKKQKITPPGILSQEDVGTNMTPYDLEDASTSPLYTAQELRDRIASNDTDAQTKQVLREALRRVDKFAEYDGTYERQKEMLEMQAKLVAEQQKAVEIIKQNASSQHTSPSHSMNVSAESLIPRANAPLPLQQSYYPPRESGGRSQSASNNPRSKVVVIKNKKAAAAQNGGAGSYAFMYEQQLQHLQKQTDEAVNYASTTLQQTGGNPSVMAERTVLFSSNSPDPNFLSKPIRSQSGPAANRATCSSFEHSTPRYQHVYLSEKQKLIGGSAMSSVNNSTAGGSSSLTAHHRHCEDFLCEHLEGYCEERPISARGNHKLPK